MYFKRILSLLLVTPLILGTISACSCGNNAITDNNNNIDDFITNYKHIKQKEKLDKLDLIEKVSKEELEKKISDLKMEFKNNDNINKIPDFEKILKIDKTINLTIETNPRVVKYFNNTFEKKLNEVNSNIVESNPFIYENIEKDRAVIFNKTETKIIVNDINLGLLNEVLKTNKNTIGRAKRLDIIYYYNIRYDDELNWKENKISFEIVIADPAVDTNEILKTLKSKVNNIVAAKLNEDYQNLFIENEPNLNPESFSLHKIKDNNIGKAINEIKRLISTNIDFEKLHKDNQISYNIEIIETSNPALVKPFQIALSEKMDNIFHQVNKEHQSYLYDGMLDLLEHLKGNDNEFIFFEGVYSLNKIKIAEFPLEGNIVNQNGDKITMNLIVPKQKILTALRIFATEITNFFKYYQISWIGNETIFKIDKKQSDFFQKLTKIVATKTNEFKMNLILKELLENFWEFNAGNKKFLTRIEAYIYLDNFNHHWSQLDNKTLFFEPKKNFNNIMSEFNPYIMIKGHDWNEIHTKEFQTIKIVYEK